MSVELHEAEEVDQQPPHHGLLVSQRLGGGELGHTEVARHLQSLEVTHSRDQETPQAARLNCVLVTKQNIFNGKGY